jgi:hypothetical protein
MASLFDSDDPQEFRNNMVCSKKTKQVTSFAIKVLTDFFIYKHTKKLVFLWFAYECGRGIVLP